MKNSMDKEKLNDAAKDFAAWETINRRNPTNNYYCKSGFIKGAEWLMSQPLAERLTEEEKEKIRNLYAQAEELELYGATDYDKREGRAFIVVFHLIFGKEMFNEK